MRDNSINQVKILVVEDEPFIALELQDTLHEAGYSVVGPALTFQQAVNLFESLPFNIALLDINIGQGEMIFPIAERIHRKHIPIAFVTGYGAHAILPEELRTCPVVEKPVNPKELLKVVRKLEHQMLHMPIAGKAT